MSSDTESPGESQNCTGDRGNPPVFPASKFLRDIEGKVCGLQRKCNVQISRKRMMGRGGKKKRKISKDFTSLGKQLGFGL
jgi:hypothetical protein